jgi:hypothetical protein
MAERYQQLWAHQAFERPPVTGPGGALPPSDNTRDEEYEHYARGLKRTHNGYLRPAEIVRYPRNVAIIGSPAALAVDAVAL